MAATTTTTSATGWSPDLTAFAPAEVIPDALILQTSTVAGHIEGDEPAVRVVWVNDDEAQFVGEGQVIPEAAPGLDETIVYTGKVAQLVKVSREQYVTGSASSLLSESVRRAVIKRANRAYLAQIAPTAPATTPPAGLLNIAGIVNGGKIGSNLDLLADAVANIESADGAATHIIAAPDVWATLRKVKAGTASNASLLGAGTEDATKLLLGIPVLTTAAMTPGTLLVVDKTAIASAVGDVVVASSEHAYFTSDSVALRCTWRIGQNVRRPDRIVKLTTA